MKLLDFDLETALKEPERVIYEDGEEIIEWKYFEKCTTGWPIIVLDEEGDLSYHSIKGVNNNDITRHLKLLPKTKTYWFCVYRTKNGLITTSDLYSSIEIFLLDYPVSSIIQEYTFEMEI